MKVTLSALLMACCVFLSAPAFAHDLEPGLYAIDVRVELPNMIDAATTLNKRVCITKKMIDQHDAFQILMETPLTSCPREPMCTNGNSVGFHVACPGRAAAHANAKFEISKTRFTGAIEMNMGGKNMVVIERQTGRRVGDCQ